MKGGGGSGEAGAEARARAGVGRVGHERSQIVSERSLSVCSYSLVFVLFVLFTM